MSLSLCGPIAFSHPLYGPFWRCRRRDWDDVSSPIGVPPSTKKVKPLGGDSIVGTLCTMWLFFKKNLIEKRNNKKGEEEKNSHVTGMRVTICCLFSLSV